jgi:hypothetical protein
MSGKAHKSDNVNIKDLLLHVSATTDHHQKA